jgi:hypothetical protein
MLWNQSQEFKTRPSALLAVEDAYAAYCIDQAVYTFGSALQHELEEVQGKTKDEIKRKRVRILTKWLDGEVRYRSPMAPTKTAAQLEGAH